MIMNEGLNAWMLSELLVRWATHATHSFSETFSKGPRCWSTSSLGRFFAKPASLRRFISQYFPSCLCHGRKTWVWGGNERIWNHHFCLWKQTFYSDVSTSEKTRNLGSGKVCLPMRWSNSLFLVKKQILFPPNVSRKTNKPTNQPTNKHQTNKRKNKEPKKQRKTKKQRTKKNKTTQPNPNTNTNTTSNNNNSNSNSSNNNSNSNNNNNHNNHNHNHTHTHNTTATKTKRNKTNKQTAAVAGSGSTEQAK